MPKPKHRGVTGQLDFFEGKGQETRASFVDELVQFVLQEVGLNRIEGKVSHAMDMTKYNLLPFRSKHSRDPEYGFRSHGQHFHAISKLYHGVYSMEAHKGGDFTGEYGVPLRLIAHLRRPSELSALYIACFEVKADVTPKGRERYKRLIELPFEETIYNLIQQGILYNAIWLMTRKEDGKIFTRHIAGDIKRLNGYEQKEFYRRLLLPRLAEVSKEDRNMFYDALRRVPIYVADQVRHDVEDGKMRHLDGIDWYIKQLEPMFTRLHGLKRPLKLVKA